MPLSIQDIQKRLKVCREKCRYYTKFGRRYKKQHLNNCLNCDKKNNNEESEKKLLEIIKREKDRSFWGRINYSTGKSRGRSV